MWNSESSYPRESNFLNMPWTIEHQLEAYARDARHTERHEALYTSWKQLGRWLESLLDYTVASFPTYSQHNVSHCKTILHNIEAILGEEEIHRLSPTDCFGILIAVYLHDLGMSITAEDKRQIVSSDDFYYSIEELDNSQDVELREAAKILKKVDYSFPESGNPNTIRDNLKKLYNEKLDVFNALGLLLGEQQRSVHARKSADKFEKWVKEADQTQSGFAMTGIPLRIFLQLAGCAKMHGEAKFETLLEELLESDNGYASDVYHPRFIAVMLMLGDILDVDNNRFNPFTKMMAGDNFNSRSEVHYKKHQSIRALKITPKKICIQADCDQPEELRLLRREFDWLEGFLRECNYHWAEIAPESFRGCLPSLEFTRIRLQGKQIPNELVTSKFQISQRKAFRLLQGSNLYECRFAFLRELFQNAIDATKQQYWNDLIAIETHSSEDDLIKSNELLPLKRYPIHIDFKIKKRTRSVQRDISDVTFEDLQMDPKEFEKKYECGVLLQIQDNGIGISEKDIRSIIEVGTSHERNRAEISLMPEWLRPNGHFGIGLQSVFLVGDLFECITRTRREECYRIRFTSGSTGDGHIDVIPQDSWTEASRIPYGTCFSVFVGENYRESRTKNMKGWLGVDSYERDYQKLRLLRNSVELMRQLEYYIDEQIGEWIFPVILREFPLHKSLYDEGVSEKVLPKKMPSFKQVRTQTISIQDVQRASFERVALVEKNNDWSSWLFHHAYSDGLFASWNDATEGTGVYSMEIENGQIKIWSQKNQCCFCCSASRILRSGNAENEIPEENNKIRVFVKGLLITEIECPGNELLEYVDIKGDALQNGLQMSRDALTEGGKERLKSIIPELLKDFYSVLQCINRTTDQKVKDNRLQIISALEKEYAHIVKNNSRKLQNEDKVIKAFSAKLRALPTENYILWNLMHEGYLLAGREEDASGTGCLQTKENKFASKIEGQKGANSLFENDLIQYINSREYLRFETNDTVIEHQQRMLRVLHDEAAWLYEKSRDCATVFLTDFVKRVDNVLDLIVQPDGDVRDLRDMIKQRVSELQGYIWLYGMLFYYTNNSTRKGCADCVQERNGYCYWQFVNSKIAEILSYIEKNARLYEEGQNTQSAAEFSRRDTSFSSKMKEFRAAIYVPGVEEENMGTYVRFSVAEILQNEHHFAVFSTRQTSRDTWKHLLVRLSPFGNRFQSPYKDQRQTVFDVLNQKPTLPSECIDRWAFLDRWNRDTIERMRREQKNGQGNASGSNTLDLEIWGNTTVWWMVHHYPTLALGASADGNDRLNILGVRARESIFLDARMIALLLERAEEMAQNMQIVRMQTYTWDGFEALNLGDNISTDIALISRGVLADENKQHRMILGVPYLLPESARMPNDETRDLSCKLKDRDQTLPQLLELIRSSYGNLGQRDWGTAGQKAIVTECDLIKSFTPLFLQSDLYSEEDEKRIRTIQKLYKMVIPEEEWDHSLLTGDRIELFNLLAENFGDLKKKYEIEEDQYTSWRQIELPISRQAYFTVFLLRVFGLEKWLSQSESRPLTENEAKAMADEEVKTVLNEALSEEDFKDITMKLFPAIRYCAYYAETEYAELFIRDICAWWKDEIMHKDPGYGELVEYCLEHSSVSTEQELEQLYLAQVRRIVCAYVSGIEFNLNKRDEVMRMRQWVGQKAKNETGRNDRNED